MKILKEVRFGPEALDLSPGKWHTMRLELVGEHARVTIDNTVVAGKNPALSTRKNKIGLNPGKAGGDLRNFRVWKAKADSN